jgi:hypothetical protein
MVILRPLLVEVFENCEGCIGSGVGVVGKAKFLAVKELGKWTLTCEDPGPGESRLAADILFALPWVGRGEFLVGVVNADPS